MDQQEMESLLDHQDWKEIVIGKKSKSPKKKNKNPIPYLLLIYIN